jgi:hypothetical protein
MSQVNNLTGLNKSRPEQLRGGEGESYFGQVELWIKQVYTNLTGVSDTKAYTVLELADIPATSYDPATIGRAAFVYVSDESGGAQMAFSDGTNWRRFTDRAVVS